MARHFTKYAVVAVTAAFAAACAGLDNPTALEDLTLDVEFEIETAGLETYQEVEIHVHVSDGGQHVQMLQSALRIEHHESGAARTVEMHAEGDGYAAHVMFFEPGEYHLLFSGMPTSHRLMYEMGEFEVEAERYHIVVGPYWVEVEMSPGQVLPGQEAHIHLHAFTIGADGMPDQPASGLDIVVEIHDLSGEESVLVVVEEDAGEYEVEYLFGDAGTYEMHVEIDVNGVEESGEFDLPISAPADDDDEGEKTGGGHGH